MKFLIAVLLICSAFAVCNCNPSCLNRAPRFQRSLKSDLEQLKALIPQSKIEVIAVKYYLFDSEFKKFAKYLQSDDVKAVWIEVSNFHIFQDVVAYLESAGVDAIKTLNEFADKLGWPRYPKKFNLLPISDLPSSLSVKGFVDEVISVLPLDKIRSFIQDKMANSADFQDLYCKIHLLNYGQMEDFVQNSPNILSLLNNLRSYKIDIDSLHDKIKEIFGW